MFGCIHILIIRRGPYSMCFVDVQYPLIWLLWIKHTYRQSLLLVSSSDSHFSCCTLPDSIIIQKVCAPADFNTRIRVWTLCFLVNQQFWKRLMEEMNSVQLSLSYFPFEMKGMAEVHVISLSCGYSPKELHGQRLKNWVLSLYIIFAQQEYAPLSDPSNNVCTCILFFLCQHPNTSNQ